MDLKLSEYRTVKETAQAWGISGRRVLTYIEVGRIPRAVMAGNMRLIPASAPRPEDLRKNNYYRPKKEGNV